MDLMRGWAVDVPHIHKNTELWINTLHSLLLAAVVIEVSWQTLRLSWKMENPVMSLLWEMEAHRLMKVNAALSHWETDSSFSFLSLFFLIGILLSQDGWPVLPLCFEVTFLSAASRGSFTPHPSLCCSHAPTRGPLPWRLHTPFTVSTAVWEVKSH